MHILIPSSGPEAWQGLLGDPEKHWRTGYSAKTLAHCWHDAPRLPREIAAAFAKDPTFEGLEALIAVPEHKVQIPGRGYPTQMDVWVLARTARGLVGIGVEGKVAEPFGQTIAEWNAAGAANKSDRLTGLADLLGVAALPEDVRYQLVHRTAGTVAEAKRFTAPMAVMAVHAFEAPDESYADYARFGRALGVEVRRNAPTSAGVRGGVELWLAWVDGDRRFREA